MPMRPGNQKTLREAITFHGHGVHSGQSACMTVKPGKPDSGIQFVRVDLSGSRPIPARWDGVSATALCTILGDRQGAYVSTVEHIMAALRACDVDNAVIEIDGPEVPIMDGSSSAFVEGLERVGLIDQVARRTYLRVLKPVRVVSNGAFGELLPFEGFRFDVDIAFDSDVIGRQSYILDLSAASFKQHIASARTFGFMKDVEHLRAKNYALGASYDNTVVVGDMDVLNPEGLRWKDEFVRHKLLDAIGDLSLAGAPILGHYRSYKGGHRVNFEMLAALFADKNAYEWTEAVPRRDVAQAGVKAGLTLPAYSPDR
jgi:UDP-3-O-[3-hydroxymyristoyl] N-acetylglucosamine deacetylase